MPTTRGTQPQDFRGLRGFFWGFLASHGAKHSPSESRSHRGRFATICGLTCHFWVLSGIAGLFPVCPPGSGFRICQPGFPLKPWTPTLCVGTAPTMMTKSAPYGPRREACRQGAGLSHRTSGDFAASFGGSWLHMVRSTLLRSPEAIGAASRQSVV